jgi:hypothetical protein
MTEIIVGNGQQVEDIAVEVYGDAGAGTVLLMEDNNLALDSLLFPGQVLKVRQSVPSLTENNIVLQRSINAENIEPNSGVSGDVLSSLYVDEDYVDDDYI